MLRKRKFVVVSWDLNAGQDHKIKIINKPFGRVEESKYLGTTLTNQNSIQEEIKSRLQSGNSCRFSVQNLLFSTLLSKIGKINTYETIILPVALYRCENCSLTLTEEPGVWVFENIDQ